MSTINYENGMYYGQAKKNIPQGLGIYFWDTGTAYFGEWSEGSIEGKGIMQIPRVGVLKAQFKNNRLNGSAHYIWKNASQMFCNFQFGQLQGPAIQINKDGKKYFFNFENGVQVNCKLIQEENYFETLKNNILSKLFTFDEILQRNSSKNESKFLGQLQLENKSQFTTYLGGIKNNKPHGIGMQSSLLKMFFSECEIDLQNLDFLSGTYQNGTTCGFINQHRVNGDVYTGFMQSNNLMDGKGFYWIEEQKKWLEAIFNKGQCQNIIQTKIGDFEDYCLDICHFGLTVHSHDKKLIQKKIKFPFGIIESPFINKQIQQTFGNEEGIKENNLLQISKDIKNQNQDSELVEYDSIKDKFSQVLNPDSSQQFPSKSDKDNQMSLKRQKNLSSQLPQVQQVSNPSSGLIERISLDQLTQNKIHKDLSKSKSQIETKNDKSVITQSTALETCRSLSKFESKQKRADTMKLDMHMSQSDVIRDNNKKMLEDVKISESSKNLSLQDQYKNFLKIKKNPETAKQQFKEKQQNSHILLIKDVQPLIPIQDKAKDKNEFQELQEKIYNRIIQTPNLPFSSDDQLKSLFNQDLSSIIQSDKQSSQSNEYFQAENNQLKTPKNSQIEPKVLQKQFIEKAYNSTKQNLNDDYIKVINMKQFVQASINQTPHHQKTILSASKGVQISHSPQYIQKLSFTPVRPYTQNASPQPHLVSSPVTMRRNCSPPAIVYPITPSRPQVILQMSLRPTNSPQIIHQQSPLFYSQIRRSYVR